MPRKGENIRKRKDGRWEGRYIKGYDTKNKKAKYVSIYGKTYAETKQKLNEAKYKTNRGMAYVNPKNKLFGEIVNSWLNMKKATLKISSINKYQSLIENHIIPDLGHIKISELDEQVMYNFLENQKKKGNQKNDGMLSTSSLRTILYILNASVKYAALRNMMPFFSIHLTGTGKDASLIQTLDMKEEERLDYYLSTHISRRNLGIMLSLYCGLRLGEVCALKWEDIDLNNSLLHVQRTVQRVTDKDGNKKTKIHVGLPKSQSSERSIPVPDFLLPIIVELAKEDRNEAYILTGSINKPMEPRTFQYYYQNILKLVEIKKTKYHTLRHTFATNCIVLGFDVKSLSEILGHSNVSITLNKYVHPSLQQKKIQMNYWTNIKGQIYGHIS